MCVAHSCNFTFTRLSYRRRWGLQCFPGSLRGTWCIRRCRWTRQTGGGRRRWWWCPQESESVASLLHSWRWHGPCRAGPRTHRGRDWRSPHSALCRSPVSAMLPWERMMYLSICHKWLMVVEVLNVKCRCQVKAEDVNMIWNNFQNPSLILMTVLMTLTQLQCFKFTHPAVTKQHIYLFWSCVSDHSANAVQSLSFSSVFGLNQLLWEMSAVLALMVLVLGDGLRGEATNVWCCPV